MVSNISNALGTQLQFQKRPEAVYERSLIRTEGANGASGIESSGMRLAQALGVLGDQASTLIYQQEIKKEKEDRDVTEAADAELTMEGRLKRNAIDILSASRKVQTAKNPYAVAHLEKLNGSAINAFFRAGYETTVIQKKGPAKTAEEEVERYAKYIKEQGAPLIAASSDSEAFQKGYFETFTVDQKKAADNWYIRKSKDMDTERVVSLAAVLRKNRENWPKMTADEFAKDANEGYADGRFANSSYDERIQLADALAQDIIQVRGDYALVEDFLQKTEIGVEDDLKTPVTAYSALANRLESYRKMAVIVATRIQDEEYQEDYKTLREMKTVAAQNAWYTEGLSSTDPKIRQRAENQLDNRERHRKYIEDAKAREDNALRQQRMQEDIMRQVNQIGNAQLDAWLDDKDHDRLDNVRGATISAMPKITYWVETADGLVRKERSMTQEETYEIARARMENIKSDSTLTQNEKDRKILKVYQWAGSKTLAESDAQLARQVLHSLRVERLEQDSEGKTVLPEALAAFIRMYEIAPGETTDILEKDTADQLAVLQDLILAEGDVHDAVTTYALSRDVLKDEDARKAVQAEVGGYLDGGTLKGFLDITGKDLPDDASLWDKTKNLFKEEYDFNASLNKSLRSNQDVYLRVQKLTAAYRATGRYTPEDAYNAAVKKVQATIYIWHDLAFPRSIFNGLKTENKASEGSKGLSRLLTAFSKQTGVREADIMMDFNSKGKVITFLVGSLSGKTIEKYYSIEEITEEINRHLEENSAANKTPKGLSDEEIANIKETKAGAKAQSNYQYNYLTGQHILKGTR